MKMCSRSYRTHVFQAEHCLGDKCRLFELKVPFQHCLSLVRTREVPLKNGYIFVSCEKWKDLILSLYNNFLWISLKEMKSSQSVLAVLNDHRILSILASVQSTNGFKHDFNLEAFEIGMKSFPLCMRNLQQILAKNHRLSHDARFNYSLFLKDIGMSFEDSVVFWRNEYSKDSSNCQKCSHSWQQDEKRYVYSIQHLYGLVGSRKTYTTRSCDYFQRSLISATEEALCPFQHFDEPNLKQLLSTYFNTNTSDALFKDILTESLGNPSVACKKFMNIALNNLRGTNKSIIDNQEVNFNNPVHYYYFVNKISK